MIEVRQLTKTYGPVKAVSGVSFSVAPGKVTAYLGPNGAGKTTTLRMLLGLVRPDSGTATIGGKPYGSLSDPLRVVGASLENSAFHPGRTGRGHLRFIATMGGISHRRIDETLQLAGLAAAADRKVGGYSLGMRQRLGLAAALLGDPPVLVLDEPTNGLDPEGIRWLRDFLKALAAEGRTVLVSSHLLREVDQTATEAVVIVSGRVRASGSISELTRDVARGVRIRTTHREHLIRALAEAGLAASVVDHDAVEISGAEPAQVGEIAARNGIAVLEMTTVGADLEAAFFELISRRDAERGVGPDSQRAF